MAKWKNLYEEFSDPNTPIERREYIKKMLESTDLAKYIEEHDIRPIRRNSRFPKYAMESARYVEMKYPPPKRDGKWFTTCILILFGITVIMWIVMMALGIPIDMI